MRSKHPQFDFGDPPPVLERFDPGPVPDDFLCSHGVQMRVNSVSCNIDGYRLWLSSDHEYEEGRRTYKCYERNVVWKTDGLPPHEPTANAAATRTTSQAPTAAGATSSAGLRPATPSSP